MRQRALPESVRFKGKDEQQHLSAHKVMVLTPLLYIRMAWTALKNPDSQAAVLPNKITVFEGGCWHQHF